MRHDSRPTADDRLQGAWIWISGFGVPWLDGGMSARISSLCVLVLGLVCGQAARIELWPYLQAVDSETRELLPDEVGVPYVTRTYEFLEVVTVAAILQRNGSHDLVVTNGPVSSWWEWSVDGRKWAEAAGARTEVKDARLLRLHRIAEPVKAKFLRLNLRGGSAAVAHGEAIFDEAPRFAELDKWILIVNSTDDCRVPNHGQEFWPLARSVPGWEELKAQQVWVGDLNRALVEAEPRPLAVFFSGSFKDWCEVDRNDWKGVAEVLKTNIVPIWASCGGAQALAIISEHGVDVPWDCPHCRDVKAPRTPIYGHIGHEGAMKKCGDYSGCVFERGPHQVRKVKEDAVFAGLGEEFSVMQSHCGQIEWTPKGWELIATAGSGSKTKTQCIRRMDAPIYAAQFHIEMEGTAESSKRIMQNFLEVAEGWQQRSENN